MSSCATACGASTTPTPTPTPILTPHHIPSPATIANTSVTKGPVAKVSCLIDDLLTDTDEFYEQGSGSVKPSSDRCEDSDNESVATDAGNAFDFSIPNSGAALNEQAIGRVFMELDAAMPKMHMLGTFLGTVSHLPAGDIKRAAQFCDQLVALVNQFSTLLDSAAPSLSVALSTPPSSTFPLASPAPPVASQRKRTYDRADIIAASPEKKQKRKTSYGIF